MVSMSARNPGPLRKDSVRLHKFLVAGTTDDLYDSRKASKRVPRLNVVASVRAIILVAFAGGIFWYLLWRLTTGLLEKR